MQKKAADKAAFAEREGYETMVNYNFMLILYVTLMINISV